MRHVPADAGREAWLDLREAGAVADVELLDMIKVERRRRFREEGDLSLRSPCRGGDDGQQRRRQVEGAQHDEHRRQARPT